MKRNSVQLNEALKKLTPQNFIDISSLLMDIVFAFNKKGYYHVKYIEIFTALNNTLHSVFVNRGYEHFSIAMVTKHVEKELSNLKEKIQMIDPNKLEVMDDCIFFKFVHYNMSALFPTGKCVEVLPLDEVEAERWWCKSFQDALFVSVDKFSKMLSLRFPDLKISDEFLKSVSFTSKNWFYEYINKSSFNLFLRFYGGWKNFVEMWPQIYFHKAHMIMSSQEHAISVLEIPRQKLQDLRSPAKSFIFCLNWRSNEGFWNIMYIDENKEINIKLAQSRQLLNELSNTDIYMYPKGKDPIIILRTDCRPLPRIPSSALLNLRMKAYTDEEGINREELSPLYSGIQNRDNGGETGIQNHDNGGETGTEEDVYDGHEDAVDISFPSLLSVPKDD